LFSGKIDNKIGLVGETKNMGFKIGIYFSLISSEREMFTWYLEYKLQYSFPVVSFEHFCEFALKINIGWYNHEPA
jgi:galactitol-specific phosphotransferase system IIC component